MRPVAPRVGLPEVMIAEEQEEYLPLAGAPLEFDDGTKGMLTRWTFTPEERQAIAEGKDLYLILFTFGQPMQPVHLEVGPPSWATPEAAAG